MQVPLAGAIKNPHEGQSVVGDILDKGQGELTTHEMAVVRRQSVRRLKAAIGNQR